MNTKSWGPGLWRALDAIAFNYPIKINKRSKKHKELQKNYYMFFTSLQYMLPCKYCRISYKKFIKELPIDDFLDSRAKLTYWLYLIHDKVNQKLINQELKALLERYQDIDKKYPPGHKSRSRERAKARRQVLYTKKSPSYESYCRRVEKTRADCGKKRGYIPSCQRPNLTKK